MSKILKDHNKGVCVKRINLLVFAALLGGVPAYASLESLTITVTCDAMTSCLDNSLDKGHAQIAVYPEGYNCASEVGHLSKREFLIWESNRNIECLAGTCSVEMSSFRFNNSKAGTFSIRAEVLSPPENKNGISTCKDDVTIFEGASIQVSDGWSEIEF